MTKKFPREEAKILELAEKLADGLAANPDLFPNPPASGEAIRAALTKCHESVDRVMAAKATYREAVAGKDEDMSALEGLMKKDFRYAEDAVDRNEAKLERIGWGAHRAATPLAPPGQARSLEVAAQGEGWLALEWKAPADGGKVATYRIERREAGQVDWSLVEIAMEHKARVSDQERGKRLEFCIVATNKAGEGEASNAVTVIL
uniref:Fibronectin type III domain-containing protein n=1 Tax=Candidatus Kentrum sp. UNK TaxID=2126344 RepID=A0A451ARP9_9GAMM|nr:MAG: Fibronectin type III domain-containing protein [Candidatus Kentron sp. UNK]VFK73699.1 MAG: Fibronectin type III domain-containing protein [Candidatus Kentron sp. UNK]